MEAEDLGSIEACYCSRDFRSDLSVALHMYLPMYAHAHTTQPQCCQLIVLYLYWLVRVANSHK